MKVQGQSGGELVSECTLVETRKMGMGLTGNGKSGGTGSSVGVVVHGDGGGTLDVMLAGCLLRGEVA